MTFWFLTKAQFLFACLVSVLVLFKNIFRKRDEILDAMQLLLISQGKKIVISNVFFPDTMQY